MYIVQKILFVVSFIYMYIHLCIKIYLCLFTGVKASLKAMKPVNEEKYEIAIDMHGIRGGPRLGRQSLMNKVGFFLKCLLKVFSSRFNNLYHLSHPRNTHWYLWFFCLANSRDISFHVNFLSNSCMTSYFNHFNSISLSHMQIV